MRNAIRMILGILVACSMASPLWAEPRRPNVLFIAVDDLRPELGCYGREQMHTPAIDRLAATGTLFERAYCQQAVCNASRASLLSGCRPTTTKVVANNINLRTMLPDVVTLPQHFKQHGYHTASVGKIFHVEGEVTDDPLAWSEPAYAGPKGKKSWYTPESLEVIRQRPAVLAAAGLPTDGKAAQRGPPFESAEMPDDAYTDCGIADRAIETLERIKGDPFFLAVGFHKPHLPYCCPKKYFDLYPLAKIELPANMFPPREAPAAAGHDLYELRSYGSVPLDGPITEDMARRLIQGYRACVSFTDAQVGRVLDKLEQLELADDTIVVFWGDHGYHLGENDVWTKMTNFEIGTRVPLIVRVPGKKSSQRTRGLVELVDLYPTLAELCGLPLPEHLEGTSFGPLMESPDRPWKEAVFSEYTLRGNKVFGTSVRTERFRYNEWVDQQGKLLGRELYDEKVDPAENDNLVDHPDQTARVNRHAKMLHDGWRKVRPPEEPAADANKPALPAKGKPDVLVILCDQWSPRYLSWDNPQVRMPNLDRLAREGTVFDACYTPSPLCMPARASLITGLYPHNQGHSIWGNTGNFHASPEAATMFQDIRQAGYSTAQIGKLHWFSNGHWRPRFKAVDDYHRACGLDFVLDCSGPTDSPNDRGPYAQHLSKLGLLKSVATDLRDRYVTWEYEPRASVVEPDNYHDTFVADRAIEYIRRQPTDRPMCLVVSFHSPHPPLDAPGKYATMYDPQQLRLPDNVPQSFSREKRELEPAEVRRMLANYLGKISLVDDHVGRLIEAMQQRGTWDNTLVAFTADHGEMMGSHGALTKGRFYEESVRVPLVLRWPGHVRAARSKAPVQSFDVYPTIVEAIGGEMTEGRFAKSLMPLATGKKKSVREVVISEIGKAAPLDIMARNARYKWWAQGDDEYLFDLENDPLELLNLAHAESHRDAANTIRQQLLTHLRSTQVNLAEGYKSKVQRLREASAEKSPGN